MNAMNEQDTGSSQILRAVKNIMQITSEVRSGSEEMLIMFISLLQRIF